MIFSKFLKQYCLCCGSAELAQTFLCQLCRVRLQFVAHYAHCLCCSELLFVEANQSKCGRCLKDPPYFQETHACFIYEALIAHLIQGLKFSGRLQVLPFLVEEMTEALKKSYGERPFPDLIIPVPLQYSGQFKRGFNQAHELGRRLAKNLSMPYSSLVAHKTQGTQAQARLTKKERVRNLKGHFQIQKMQGVKSVALIDDVMTTGSTLRELAHALHQAGVEEVHLWVVARARL